MINQILMYLMAFGVVLGGADLILGNRFGLGEKFEEGFRLLGPIAMSMAGIVCLTPLIADFAKVCITPLLNLCGIDPAVCGGILPVDAGGYQLALELAADPTVGQYAGVVIGGTFGCTVAFLVPVGMGVLDKAQRQDFVVGLLIGLAALPVSLIAGGMVCGLPLLRILHQTLPVLLISALLILGLTKFSAPLIRGFAVFARGIRILTLLGLMAGAAAHLTGRELLPGISPLKDAMETVCGIGIVLLGCLPLAELLRRMLGRPVRWIGRKTGLRDTAITALLMGAILAMPALTMMKDMDRRGRIVTGAFLVCGASALSAHLGFTLGVSPEMVMPLLAAKFAGAVCAAAIAIILTNKTSSV